MCDDRSAIADLLSAYCQLCDDGAFDELARLFTPSGSMVVLGSEVAGRRSLADWFEEAQPPHRRGKHIAANLIIDINGTIATATSDFLFVRFIRGALAVESAGRYIDHLERSDDGWMISRRVIDMLTDPRADTVQAQPDRS